MSANGNLSSKSTVLAVSKSNVIIRYVISWVKVVPIEIMKGKSHRTRLDGSRKLSEKSTNVDKKKKLETRFSIKNVHQSTYAYEYKLTKGCN